MVEPTFDIEHGIVVFFVVGVESMAVGVTIWFKVNEAEVWFGCYESSSTKDSVSTQQVYTSYSNHST